MPGASNPDNAWLSTLNPTARFSDRVDDYVKHRPTYPTPAIDSILSGLGDPGALVAADIGAGTGISTRLLADRGVRVLAIEPNKAMRDAATPHLNVEWRDGTAESTGLPAASVDLVLCAQAYHWFRPREALAEFARILKSRGRLALMWNARDRSDPFTNGYTQAIVAIGGESRAETHKFDADKDAASVDFSKAALTVVPHEQVLDLDGLIGRALSASYVPKSGPGHEQLIAELTSLFQEYAREGAVKLKYRTEVYLFRRVGSQGA